MDPPQQQEKEYEVYGIDIPEEAIMEADEDMIPVKNESEPTSSKKILENVQKRLSDLNKEARILQEKKAKVEKEMGIAGEDSSGASIGLPEKEEIDSRSIFVGNVDYACNPEEIQQHFQSCGTVNRVTILSDIFGQPKGYAYVEFAEVDAVQNALLLNETELHGRPLRVLPKRTNIPGMKQNWGPFGYGKIPRFRRAMRYRPYY
ncbi:polyadenylate-binding protein 1-like isoform X1 [Phoenix dactylifera]|uniref:Polyadenylate-binding protein 1-like isoform X1 n=1 Tax=Phoenix dactylifera TaxID=42345 RepID=A0A8B8ZGY1_PHODC|nr:polyadenylate-binding protein 1-like isoform X1 [Phoenix dactylifera]